MRFASAFILSFPTALAFTVPSTGFQGLTRVSQKKGQSLSFFEKIQIQNKKPLFVVVSDDASAKEISDALEDSSSAEVQKRNLLGKPKKYSEITIGVMKETYPGENRVSQSPESVALLVKAGFDVVVESGGK